VPERARVPRRYSARYKARTLDEYERLNEAGKGALLRREGLYTSLASECSQAASVTGALQALAKPAGRQPIDPATARSIGSARRTSVCPASLARPAR
jgi:transposase